MAEETASSYDKRSFLSGIAVGRQLKGWATGGSAGGGGSGSLSITENGEYDVKKYAQVVVNVQGEIQRQMLRAHLVLLQMFAVNPRELHDDARVTPLNAKLVPIAVLNRLA